MDDKTQLLKNLRIDRDAVSEDNGSRKLHWWKIGAGAVLSIAIVGWLVGQRTPAAVVQAATAQPLVESALTASSSILDASGYVVARRQTTVSAKITGKVARVLIEEGERVERDQILAVLDDSNLVAELEQARAEVGLARANLVAADTALANARPIFQRSERLVQNKTISEAAFDESKAEFDDAQSRVAVARESLRVAQASELVAQRNSDDAIIRAPFGGVVTVKAAQPGEIVSPLSAGGGFTRTGICTIVDMDSLEVDVDISESYIDRLHTGQPATVKLNAYPDWQIPADVIAIVPTADRSKATVKVRVAFKQRDARIIPEMGTHLAFLSEAAPARSASAQAGVVVPPDAVVGSGADGVVFVIKGRAVERRAVQLGTVTQAGRVITAGLQPGTRVATGDVSRLRDGMSIKIVE